MIHHNLGNEDNLALWEIHNNNPTRPTIHMVDICLYQLGEETNFILKVLIKGAKKSREKRATKI